MTIDNVLVHNGEVTGIIDWSGGAFGDPRYDVSLAIRPKHHIFEWESDKLCFFEVFQNDPGPSKYALELRNDVK